MKDFFARRWFLLLLAAEIGLAAARPEWLRPYTGPLSPLLVIAPALFLMAWGLESRSLVHAVVRPLPTLWATSISFGVLPVLAWMAMPMLPNPDLQIGLLICSCVPCTMASAVIWTRLAGGNDATTLLVVVLTTCTSWLITPTWLYWMTKTVVAVDTPGMMRNLLVALVVPVGLGQLLRTIGPLARLATGSRQATGVISRLLVLVVILKAAVAVSEQFRDPTVGVGGTLLLTAAVCVGIHLTALALGFWGGQCLCLDRPDRIAVAFAGSQKTLPVALYVYEEHYKALPLAVLSMVCYHVGQLVVDSFIADHWANQRRDEATATAKTME